MNHSCASEWGGVGGEYYKNSYCRYFIWSLWKNGKTVSAIKRNLFPDFEKPQFWESDLIKAEKTTIQRYITELIESSKENNLLASYNAMGFHIMSRKVFRITNGYSSFVTKVDPLFERAVISKASRTHPVLHSMAIWQRKEIHKYCPRLSDLKTDQGYSCTVKPIKLFYERIKALSFWCSRIIARIRKKIGVSYVDSEPKYWDNDYKKAMKTDLFKQAFAVCKEIGVVDKETDENMLPAKKIGDILLVGMVFSKESHAQTLTK